MDFETAHRKFDLDRSIDYYENSVDGWATNCEIEQYIDDLKITVWCKLDVKIVGDEIADYEIDIIEVLYHNYTGDFCPYSTDERQIYEKIIDKDMLDNNMEYFIERIY